MKPHYAPQRRKLLALDPQPAPGLIVRTPVELAEAAGRQTDLAVPEEVRILGEPLQAFAEACGGPQSISLAVVRRGTGESAETDVFRQPFVLIGRCAENDLVLADDTVGFRHLYLQLNGGRWMFVNLDDMAKSAASAPGISRGWFDVGCELEVGPYTIRCVAQAPPLAAIPAPGPATTPIVLPAVFPAYELEFVNGQSRLRGRRSQQITESIAVIGSGRQCNLRLRDEGVSKAHASLVLTAQGLWIVDLLGRDGVLVNDVAAYWKQLDHGSVLQVGRFRFRVHFGAERDQPNRRAVAPGTPEIVAQPELTSNRHPSNGHPSNSQVPNVLSSIGQTSNVPAPPSRGSLSEESLVALFERMGQMQSEFLEHSQLQTQVITQLLAHLGRTQQAAVRQDLDRIDKISLELEAIKSELPARPGRKSRRWATKKMRSRATDVRVRSVDPSPPNRDATVAAASPPRAEGPSPIVPPVLPGDSEAFTSNTPITPTGKVEPVSSTDESLPAASESAEGDFFQPDDDSQPDATAPTEARVASDAHALRLTQRMTQLARERNSVWKRVLNAFGGTRDSGSSVR